MGNRSGAVLAAAGLGAAGLAAARWRAGNHRAQTARSIVERDVEPSRRVVVLGAGFGGLYAAIRLADEFWSDPETEVLLVDRHNYHLFTPMLTLVAASAIAPRGVAYPVRRLLRDHHLAFRRAEVQSIDLGSQTVQTDKGPVHYDKLVIGLGSVTNFFGLTEVETFGFKFKAIADAVEIRNHIVDCFERASVIEDPEQRREWLTISLVGGGPTGVELAAAIHDFIHHTLVEEYPNISFDEEVRIMLFEMQDRLLPNHEGDLAEVSAEVLRHKNVDVRLNSAIANAWEGGVRTKAGEEIPTRTLVWTAGVQANPVIKDLAVEKGRGGAIVVDSALRVPGQTGVYALGDNAAYTDPKSGKPLPPDAKVALQQAGAAAANVIRELRAEEPEPFVYRYFGDMISLGTNAAVADVLGYKLTGLPAWLLWRLYYLGRLQGVENKFRVLADWAAGTVFERYTARLDLDTKRSRAAQAAAPPSNTAEAATPGGAASASQNASENDGAEQTSTAA
jgi:NADH:ubiquinone reductase (H+-translocating)